MNNNPLVSVVVTTFNRPDKLFFALWSIYNQTYTNIEVFVIDASNQYKNQVTCECFGFQYIPILVDKGVQNCRNIGLSYCNGRYIAYLDDDDIWYPDKIEKQVQLIESDKDIGLVVCHSKTITDQNVFVETPKEDIVFRDLLLSFNLSYTSTYMIRKTIFDIVGGWNEKLVSMHEYDLGLRIAKNSFKIKTVPIILMEKNNNLDDDSRRFYGSFFMKIHEVFLLWRYYGKDMKQVLSVKDFCLNYIKTLGLFTVFLCGYIFRDRVWNWIYGLKVWYEKIMCGGGYFVTLS